MGGRNIGHDGGIIEGMAQRSDQGKIPINGTLGQNGEYDKVSVPGRTHRGGIGMDDNGTHT